MKRFVIFLVVSALALGVATSARAGQVYPDVKSGHWAEKDIAKMKAKGIVAGFSDGYHPSEPVSREQAIVMIVKAMGKAQEAKGKALPATFKNADKVSSWAKESLALAVQEGIIAGGDLLDFRPKDAAKRYEMAVFIGRALGYTAADVGTKKPGFKDASQIPGWAQGYVAAVVEEGVMSGLNDGTFRPNAFLNRAQMASLLASLDKKLDRLGGTSLRGEVFSVSSTSNSLLLKDSTGLIQTVQLAKDAYIYKNKSISLGGLAKGDQVLAVLNSQDEALFVEVVEEKLPAAAEQIISGTIISVQQGNPAAVTIKHSAGESTYTVDAAARLFMDNKSISPSGLAAGQEVTAAVKNGRIEKLTGRTVERGYLPAETVESAAAGRVKAITIASSPTIAIIASDNKEKIYRISAQAEIRKGRKRIDLTQIKVGDYVEIELEGGLVTKMEVEARFVQTYFVGKIADINAKSKVLVLKTGEDNDEYRQVLVGPGTYIIKFDDDISFSGLEEEDEVIAVGEYEAGVFNASSIIVIGGRE